MYEATDDTIHTIADKLNSAKEKTSEIGGLTQDEINHVADAVSRDVHHALVLRFYTDDCIVPQFVIARLTRYVSYRQHQEKNPRQNFPVIRYRI
jgi:hypothetical protein